MTEGTTNHYGIPNPGDDFPADSISSVNAFRRASAAQGLPPTELPGYPGAQATGLSPAPGYPPAAGAGLPPVRPSEPAPGQTFAPPPATYVPGGTQASFGAPQAAPVSPVAPPSAAAPQRVPTYAAPAQFSPSAAANAPQAPVAPQAPAGPAAAAPQASVSPTRPSAEAATRRAPAEAPGTVNAGRLGMVRAHENDVQIEALLRAMHGAGASDLHLTAGAYPMMRRHGALQPMEEFGLLDGAMLQRVLYSVLNMRQRERFEAELELDFSYQVPDLARFRVNFYKQREQMGAAFRTIPFEIKPLEALGVPAVVANFAGLPRGLVLVTGPTGSGKSTTLASIIDLANRTRPDHIMTVEDPIEFLHTHKRAIINQREVGADTQSFANALKHVLRQDPDIILVGEMRDLETISVALTAAETGHLVFATLHTQDAAQTIDRIIDVFPPEQQGQVRTQLAGALQGVVSQTLCRRSDGPGRVVATEVMLATPAIRNLIREGKTHQIYSSMQAGSQQGMHTMDQHLAELTRSGRISYETGLEKCHNLEDYNKLTGRASASGAGAGLANANMGGADFQSKNRTV
ncbi:twitching motility protein PilT [Flavimobilis soli]|uniref:Twitching motility protein PilT n=1 Tax=Flavimobilis soli TaxID=442709 RepID=A0A2A9EBQ7_9MICO|nr:type IV pilus twitching motility protein PilT [Flavimobilis soli]PFG35650.1 twitching motility protein PilT [Flavimobilis soli]